MTVARTGAELRTAVRDWAVRLQVSSAYVFKLGFDFLPASLDDMHGVGANGAALVAATGTHTAPSVQLPAVIVHPLREEPEPTGPAGELLYVTLALRLLADYREPSTAEAQLDAAIQAIRDGSAADRTLGGRVMQATMGNVEHDPLIVSYPGYTCRHALAELRVMTFAG